MTDSKGAIQYLQGEIVLVRHQDNPTLPINEYIGYIRETVDSHSETIPLINAIGDQLTLNSRSRFKKLEFRLDGSGLLVLKRGKEVKKLKIGGLYEVEYQDNDARGPLPGNDSDINYKIVGCYNGMKHFYGYDYYMLSNVCETDPKKIKLKSKDKTFGRRILNRLRQDGILKITQLKRR